MANPMVITGMEPIIRSPEWVTRGPMRSHSQPTTSRATMVTATEAMTVLPISALVSCRSSRTMAIIGAMPNQPKKARKKAIQLMWNTRICGCPKLNNGIFVAFLVSGSIPMLIAASIGYFHRASIPIRDYAGRTAPRLGPSTEGLCRNRGA